MKHGIYKNIEFKVWEDPRLGIYYWKWGYYGAQTTTMGQCWEGIRRAACEWSMMPDGSWHHSQEEIAS